VSPAGAAGAPGFLSTRSTEGQGLAGSAADRLARGGSISDSRSTGPDPDVAGLVAASGTAASMPPTPDERIDAARTAERDADLSRYARSVESSSSKAKRRTVSSTRGGASTKSQREHVQDGPSWENSRRYESYPQIRSGPSLPTSIPRVAVLAGALALAAVGLFFLPALFGIGGDDGASPSPSASEVVATATPDPTPTPEPTPQTYTIQEGDTLSAIAADFGLSLDELLAANEDTIEDPNRISVGDVIVIPVPPPDEVDGGASEAPAEESPAP
jgi:LysM repeat protein